jgi:DNA-binding NarL/FixJ family response regulator
MSSSKPLPTNEDWRNCIRCGKDFLRWEREVVCETCRKVPAKASELKQGDPLTRREKQIVALLHDARTNAEIASNLHLSDGTVKQMMHRIFKKTGARNRVGLALMAERDQPLIGSNA